MKNWFWLCFADENSAPNKIDSVIEADLDDDKVLACAKSANVEIIASGDSHLLDLNEY